MAAIENRDLQFYFYKALNFTQFLCNITAIAILNLILCEEETEVEILMF